jgi:hypothetical protein
MISILVSLLILLIVLSLAYWIIGQLPLPPPVRQIATVIIVVIAVVFLIYFLMGIAGPGREFPLR